MKYPSKKQVRDVGRKIYKVTGLVNPYKKGKVSSARIIKDIAMLKGIINSEKFRVESQPCDQQGVGQVNQNGSGHYLADFTPLPSQGDGYNNRQGNSIRWKSSHYSFFFQRQSGSSGPVNVKIQLIKVIGEAYSTPSSILGKFIEPNRWISGGTVYDTASDRKPEYFKQYRVLRTIKVNFPALAVTGTGGATQKIINFGLKLPNHHVKWNNNSNTLADGQVLCLVTCDTGNMAGAASTLDSIANTAASTGLLMSVNKIDYYYDN